MSDSPTVLGIKRYAGDAGQMQYTVTVQYPGEAPETSSFVGSVYGGPVVAISPAGHQTFVRNPERFGTFGAQWVRRFFA